MAPLYFPNLIQINYNLMLRMKWLWFVPNLKQILSVFLKLQDVKQSGPGFFGLPGLWACDSALLFPYRFCIKLTLWDWRLDDKMIFKVTPSRHLEFFLKNSLSVHHRNQNSHLLTKCHRNWLTRVITLFKMAAIRQTKFSKFAILVTWPELYEITFYCQISH